MIHCSSSSNNTRTLQGSLLRKTPRVNAPLLYQKKIKQRKDLLRKSLRARMIHRNNQILAKENIEKTFSATPEKRRNTMLMSIETLGVIIDRSRHPREGKCGLVEKPISLDSGGYVFKSSQRESAPTAWPRVKTPAIRGEYVCIICAHRDKKVLRIYS